MVGAVDTSDPLAEDAQRAAAIRRYRVLDEPGRDDLRTLVEVAALVADVPMATINIITEDEQHQVAAVGFDAAVCDRRDSMCAAVLHEAAPVVLSDASADPRFSANPFVTGELGAVRFYATYQLHDPSGLPVGSLCLFDTVPRTIDDERRRTLRALADRVVDLLELHLRTRELTTAVDSLRESRTELARSNEHLTAFAGQVSHDLRTPLTAVSSALRMLADEIDTPAGSTQQDMEFLLERALSGATRMQSLIDDLLSFARIGGELRRLPVDLGACLEEVRQDLAVALEGATVEVDALPTVVGDSVHLRAVLQNLLANAAKFTRPGEPAHVTVTAHQTHDAWRVEVHDRGPGVPPEEREAAFRPLARLDTTVEGFGIGLATCRRIVHAHGGRMAMDASPYGGAVVWFELPDDLPG